MSLTWLPALERDEHARSNPWAETSDPKGCLHTTEGPGWPAYDGWSIMPHATIMPIPGKGIRGKQHLPLSQGSFALRNEPGGVQTNRDFVFQFELIGTCERNGDAYRAGAYYWPDADDAVLRDLYEKVIKPVSDGYGIPLRSQPWQAYPAAYGARGATNTVRMSGPAFDGWSGWLGHQHVPENVHGDPGKFPWSRMMEAADDMALDSTDKAFITKAIADHAFTVGDLLDGTLTLSTPARVDGYNSLEPDPAKRKTIGDTITLESVYMWGAAGQNRQLAEARAAASAQAGAVAALQVQMAALTAAVAAIADANPDAITAAFTAGAAKLEQQLAALDVHITVGDDTPPT